MRGARAATPIMQENEGAVTALDQRGVVIRLYAARNPNGDDRHG